MPAKFQLSIRVLNGLQTTMAWLEAGTKDRKDTLIPTDLPRRCLLSKKNHQDQTDNDDGGSEHQNLPVPARSCFWNLVPPLLDRRFNTRN